jgi:hypothetical protein
LKRLEVLLCFDYQNGITNEEEDMMFANEPKLFSIVIISIPLKTLEIVVINTIQPEKTIKVTDSKVRPFHNFKSNTETLALLIRNLRLA